MVKNSDGMMNDSRSSVARLRGWHELNVKSPRFFNIRSGVNVKMIFLSRSEVVQSHAHMLLGRKF